MDQEQMKKAICSRMNTSSASYSCQNCLSEKDMFYLERIITLYLDYTELQAE